MPQLYGANNQLLCAVCNYNSAISKRENWCPTCASKAANVLHIFRALDKEHKTIGDIWAGLYNCGIDGSDLRQSSELLKRQIETLKKNPLYMLSKSLQSGTPLEG